MLESSLVVVMLCNDRQLAALHHAPVAIRVHILRQMTIQGLKKYRKEREHDLV